MLSILIPVYNQDVTSLVNDVQKQCDQLQIDYQILVFDDKSEDKYRELNASLSHSFNVNYVELSENIGRAKIRNRLGKMARYKYLLFLDGDTKIVKSDFISHYVRDKDKAPVIFGGRGYQKAKPKDIRYILHWRYGRAVESRSANIRNQNPYLNFHSNNFLILSHTFSKHLFDTSVDGYGYEDLLFAESLCEKGARILHIDNETLHDGLELSERFLDKTKNAVRNLAELNQQESLINVRLTKFHTKHKSLGTLKILLWFYKKNEASIVENLKSSSPRLLYYSLFKLYYYNEVIDDL